MKTADFIIRYLRDYGIERVFQVYGSATADLIDAFSRTPGIEYICTIHEQAAGFAAETLAKVTGKLQCAMATSGPGGINLLNPMANCFYDSVPVLFITGQVNSKFLRKSPTQRQVGFQENDIVSMARPVTKYVSMIENVGQVKRKMDDAIYLATHGRPGPVLLDIPMDVQRADLPPDARIQGWSRGELNPNIDAQLDHLLDALERATRPVLLVGGGIHWAKAAEDVRKLASILKIPSIPTWNATDIITSDFEYYAGRVGTFGGPGRNFAIQNCDLLLSIGSRISGRITGGVPATFVRGAKKFIVDNDITNLNPNWQEMKGDCNIQADAGYFIHRLLERFSGHDKYGNGLPPVKLPDWSGWLTKCQTWRDTYIPQTPKVEGFVNPYAFIKALSARGGIGDVIVVDCGGNAVVTFQMFETKWGQRLISSNGNSPMGYSFAGAMGVCFDSDYRTQKKGRVICIIGDGGMQMNIQELQTVRHYNLPLKTFILNNHCYGITRQFQRTNYEGRYLACGPDGYSVPDFLKITDAYGIKTDTIQDNRGMRQKIDKILNNPEAVVCDVDCGGWSHYEPRISGWNTPVEDMTPLLSREEFRANMIIEPVEGWKNRK